MDSSTIKFGAVSAAVTAALLYRTMRQQPTAGAGPGAGAGSTTGTALVHPTTTAKPNLTQSEAEARSAVISNVSYQLRLDLGTGDEYTGVAVVSFDTSSPAAGTFLDFSGKQITKLLVNGEPCPGATWETHRLQIPGTALQATGNTVTVEYRNAYDRDGAGLHTFTDPADNETYLYTNLEPYEALKFMPCFDQPDLKARLTLSATAPPHWVVVGNEVATKGSVTGQGDSARRLWTFATTPPLSTYLFAVCAGPYVVRTSVHNGKTPLGIYARKSYETYLDRHVEELMTVTKQGLTFYADFFGLAYPFSKYDQLFVPEFNHGAMENAGAVTFTEQYLFRDTVVDAMLASRADTVLHEMAHMYFGDLVTMQWWDGLWLNESFATFMAAVAVSKATRFGDVSWVNYCTRMKFWGYGEDQLPTTHAIQSAVADTLVTFDNFDGVTYGKGSAVVKQLAHVVGFDHFRDGLRAYFAKHKWGNATLDDFLSAIQSNAPSLRIDLKDWSKSWLETAGLNTVRPEFVDDGEGNIKSFSILQAAPENHPTLRYHKLDVALFYGTADSCEVVVHSVEVDAAARTEVPSLVGKRTPVAVFLNWNDYGYVKVRLDDVSAANLPGFVNSANIPSALNRVLVWSVWYDMTRDAEMSARTFLALARDILPSETDGAILKSVLPRRVGPALRAFIPESMYPATAAEWFAICAEQVSSSAAGDSRLVWCKLMASCAWANADTASTFIAFVDGDKPLEGFKAESGDRWTAAELCAAFSLGDVEARIHAELAADTSDRAKRCAETCRILRNDPAVKAAAWERFCNPSPSASRHMVRAAMDGFQCRAQSELLQPYTDKFFDVAIRVFSEAKSNHARDFFDALCPPVGDDDAVIRKLEKLLKAVPSDNKGMQRIVAEQLDSYQRVYRCRQLVLREAHA